MICIEFSIDIILIYIDFLIFALFPLYLRFYGPHFLLALKNNKFNFKSGAGNSLCVMFPRLHGEALNLV